MKFMLVILSLLSLPGYAHEKSLDDHPADVHFMLVCGFGSIGAEKYLALPTVSQEVANRQIKRCTSSYYSSLKKKKGTSDYRACVYGVSIVLLDEAPDQIKNGHKIVDAVCDQETR